MGRPFTVAATSFDTGWWQPERRTEAARHTANPNNPLLLDRERTFIRLSFGFLYLFRKRGNDLKQITDRAIVGALKDRGVLILVDSHDRFGSFDAHEMLNCPGNPDRKINLRRHSLPGAAHLPLHRQPAIVADGTGGREFSA